MGLPWKVYYGLFGAAFNPQSLWMFMRHVFPRLALLFGLASLLVVTAPAQAQRRAAFPATPSEVGQALYDVRMGFQRLSTGDPRGAIEMLTRAIDSGRLPDQTLGSAYFFRGAAHREQGNFRDALTDLSEASKRAPERGQVPVLEFDVLLRMDRYTDAASKALLVAKEYPAEANSFSLSAIQRVNDWLLRNKRANDAFALRAALFDAQYRGGVGTGTADGYFQQLVGDYLDRNDLVNAMRVASSLSTVDVLIDLLVDKRFEEVWDAIQSEMGGDFVAAARKQLQGWEKAGRAAVSDADVVQGLIDSHRLLGDSARATRIADQYLADPVAIGRDPTGYFWVVSKSAFAEVEAGRPARGIERMAELSGYALDDYPELVTHRINQAALLLDQGRFDDAVKAARSAQSRYLSPFGQQWVRAIEACATINAIPAKQQSSRDGKAAIDAALAPLRDKRDANPSAYAYALLCANRLDDAEQWYIRRLGDPAMRGDALQALQIFAAGKGEPPAYSQIQERLAKVRDRAKVRQAVNKVGRVMTIALPRSVLGGY
jgi:tetratricopeptide (TPR) repeat protein